MPYRKIFIFFILLIISTKGESKEKYLLKDSSSVKFNADSISDIISTKSLKLSSADCNIINWATWSNFSGQSATGAINNNGTNVSVTMTSNFAFDSTPSIYGFERFSGYSGYSSIPNSTVPRTTWVAGAGGTTTMCFSQQVSNPVLLLSSLGASDGTQSKLTFSVPYVVLYDGGGMVYNDSYSLTGTEGYALIMFPGNFTCVTVNSSTYEYYTNITWGLNPPPFNVDITESHPACGSVVLQANGGVTYHWNGGDTPNSATNTFHISGTYIVTVTNDAGCVTSVSKDIQVDNASTPTISGNATGCGSVVLTANGDGAVSYHWDGGLSPNSAQNTFTQSGTYHVTVTYQSQCTVTAEIAVFVTPSQTTTIEGNTTGCGSVTLTASDGATSYQWDGGTTPDAAQNTFTQSGTYHVTATFPGGCTSVASKTILINPAPQVTITGDTDGCDEVTLTASTGAIAYQWDGGSSPTNAQNTFTLSGTYHLTALYGNGCSSSASVNVTVTPTTALSLNLAASATSICAGDAVTFTANITSAGPGQEIKWFKNNGQLSATGTTYTTADLQNDDQITCVLTSSAKCTAPSTITSNAVNMQVNPIPQVSFDQNYSIAAGKNILLTPIINGNIKTYVWTPTDGISNPDIGEPFASPLVTTTYQLTVISDNNCTATASVKVTVTDPVVIVPNSFTPNGDNINDLWNIASLQAYVNCDVTIYNRYGVLIYRSIGYSKAWDGTYGGREVPAGVYYYLINLNDNKNTKISGYVTLIR